MCGLGPGSRTWLTRGLVPGSQLVDLENRVNLQFKMGGKLRMEAVRPVLV